MNFGGAHPFSCSCSLCHGEDLRRRLKMEADLRRLRDLQPLGNAHDDGTIPSLLGVINTSNNTDPNQGEEFLLGVRAAIAALYWESEVYYELAMRASTIHEDVLNYYRYALAYRTAAMRLEEAIQS